MAQAAPPSGCAAPVPTPSGRRHGLPPAEVADVAVVPQFAGPCFGYLDHGIVEANWEQDELLAGALLGEGFGHLVLDPVALDGVLGQDQQDLVAQPDRLVCIVLSKMVSNDE
jgi:hypothetical protein